MYKQQTTPLVENDTMSENDISDESDIEEIQEQTEDNNNKTFACKRFGTEFKSKHHLKQHYQRHIVCDAKNSTQTYAELMELDFPKINKPFKCAHCDKTFTQQSNRSRHQTTCIENRDNHEPEEVKQLRKIIEEKDAIISQLQHENAGLREPLVGNVVPSATQYKKKKISKATRANCWRRHVQTTIGHGQTLCFCCKINTIDPYDWGCGHIVAESRGGSNDIENLRPICRHCNGDMGVENMREFALRMYNNVIP